MSEEKKVALVTGASRGIGRAIARHLAETGHIVIGTATSAAGAANITAYLREEGNAGCGMNLNVTSEDSVAAVIKAITEQFAAPLVLVNNAGITRDRLFLKMTRADWDAVIDTNLSSMFNVTKQVVADMVEQGWGRIIQISSVNGEKGQAGQTNYSAAKAGMHGFSMALALELAAKGVTVNTVSPGYIGTDMVNAIRPEVLAKLVSQVPVGRMGTPAEIASIVAWLAGEDSGYTTGAEFSCNGGLHMS
jgi:acetoacetyl-CoA reductase